MPIALVAAVAWSLDLTAIRARLGSARIGPIVWALALGHLVIAASALRWADTARRLGHPIPPGRAVAEYYVSSMLNQVLPGGVAGDASRAWRARRAAGVLPVARGVVIERLAGQVALAVTLVFGLLLGGVPGTGPLVASFIGGLAAIVVGAALLKSLGPDLRRAWCGFDAVLVQGALNLVVTGALIGGFALCARAVGTDLTVAQALTLLPVCLAAMLVPAGIGGLGLREGAAAALWPLAGFAAEAGVAAALLFGLVSLVAALPGAVLLIRHRG